MAGRATTRASAPRLPIGPGVRDCGWWCDAWASCNWTCACRRGAWTSTCGYRHRPSGPCACARIICASVWRHWASSRCGCASTNVEATMERDEHRRAVALGGGEDERVYATGYGELAEAIIACARSEEHTSELQSRGQLVCRLLLEKKKRRENEL